MNAGFWVVNYWPTDYWVENYWPDRNVGAGGRSGWGRRRRFSTIRRRN